MYMYTCTVTHVLIVVNFIWCGHCNNKKYSFACSSLNESSVGGLGMLTLACDTNGPYKTVVLLGGYDTVYHLGAVKGCEVLPRNIW